MKSIVQEASSIEKAINKAWEEAGRPAEFSVRILEHPTRNFFGFLKRSAKVALVFPSQNKSQERSRDKKPVRDERPNRDKKHENLKSESVERTKKSVRQERPTPKQPDTKHTRRDERTKAQHTTSELSKALAHDAKKIEKPSNQQELKTPSKHTQQTQSPEEQPRTQVTWEPQLVEKVQEQLNALLGLIDKKNATYTTSIQGRELLITFSDFILENEDQDRRLFSGLSPLLMTIIKREFKKALRGYRLVLGHAK